MKKLILISCFFLSINSLKAQDVTGIVTGTTFNYQMISNTQHNFTFQTYFNLGYLSTCPTLINPTFTIINDTLYVKGYYDITGAWPTSFCNSFDTITYNYQLPSNVTQIITSTNIIGYNNTPPYTPSIITYENVYTQTFNAIQLNNLNFNTNANNISVYPNPVKDILKIEAANTEIQKFELYDLQGRLILSEKIENDKYQFNISHLQNSTYQLKLYTDKGVQNLKIIKK